MPPDEPVEDTHTLAVQIERVRIEVDALRQEYLENRRMTLDRITQAEIRIATLEALNVDVVEEAIWRVMRQMFNRQRMVRYARRVGYVLSIGVAFILALVSGWIG